MKSKNEKITNLLEFIEPVLNITIEKCEEMEYYNTAERLKKIQKLVKNGRDAKKQADELIIDLYTDIMGPEYVKKHGLLKVGDTLIDEGSPSYRIAHALHSIEEKVFGEKYRRIRSGGSNNPIDTRKSNKYLSLTSEQYRMLPDAHLRMNETIKKEGLSTNAIHDLLSCIVSLYESIIKAFIERSTSIMDNVLGDRKKSMLVINDCLTLKTPIGLKDGTSISEIELLRHGKSHNFIEIKDNDLIIKPNSQSPLYTEDVIIMPVKDAFDVYNYVQKMIVATEMLYRLHTIGAAIHDNIHSPV